MLTRRSFLYAAGGALAAFPAAAQSGVEHYARFERGGKTFYGVLEGDDAVRAIEGDLFGARRPIGKPFKLSEVTLLYPIEPPKVLAVGLNYKSHIGAREAPTRPEIFYKPITALQHPGGPIVKPPDSKDLHYEAEFVIVIGKRAKNVSVEDAPDYILGYTCGNDVSDRNWQNGSIDKDADLQWWRGKGADTFAPLGPYIAVGLDYKQSRIRLRLNGEVKQDQALSDLLFDAEAIVSFVSHYVTLTPGDVIYTGTPGSTSPMKPGDKVQVEIDGIGVLENYVKAG